MQTAMGASGYSKLCPLNGSPFVELEYDPSTKQFTVVSDNVELNQGNRSLQDETIHLGKHLNSHSFRGAKYRRLDEAKRIYTARHCPCDATGETYCIVDSDISSVIPDTCGIPEKRQFLIGASTHEGSHNTTNTNNITIECFEMTSQTVFIRNAWPVVVLWYGALVIFFLATANGRYAQMCLVNTFCPCFKVNERYVDRVLRREIDMRSRLRSLQAAAQRADDIAEGPGRFLRRTRGLRVRRYPANDQELTDEEQRDQVMRAWVEAAEAFGIFDAREVPDISMNRQPMEYALRVRKFDAKKERSRRKHHDTEQSANRADPSNITTPTKSLKDPIDHSENEVDAKNGPNTPETVATSESNESRFNFDETDNEVGESSLAENMDEEPGLLVQNCNETISEHDDDVDCTICLSEVCDGDEVGVLTCEHIFHIDCLKEWLLRRNACPLCQTEICTPRPAERDGANVAMQNSSADESEVSSGDNETHDLRNSRNNRQFIITDSLPDLNLFEARDPERRMIPANNRPYIITTSLPDFELREPSIRRSMSGTITATPSRRNRRDYNRGRSRRQHIEDPFSFSGW